VTIETAVDAGRLPAAILAAATIGCGLSACSGGDDTSSGTVSAHRPTTAAAAGSRQRPRQLRLPSVGVVVVTRQPDGLLLYDRATQGKRFVLSGAQVGECLSFIRANPGASKRDLRAACPGEAKAQSGTPGAATSTGP
jgi:hypothetical protein